MSSKYQVLIIEDDFKVAQINQQFVEQVDGFSVMSVVHTGQAALQFLEKQTPDLILLDVYIPDVEGVELLWKIKEKFKQVDVIMITAAKEVPTIEEALRGGAIDYIVKPVEFSRFEKTLQYFAKKKNMLENKTQMDQEEIDQLWGLQKEDEHDLPKGIDTLTLKKVKEVLTTSQNSGITAVELGDEIGTSRTTARRYLEYLISLDMATAELKYGKVGRPERRYFQL